MSHYSVVRAAEAPDHSDRAPGAFYGYGRALCAEQLRLNVRVLAPHTAHVPPGADPAMGHSHRGIEEIYFVLEGEIAVKAGDDVLRLGPRDAIRLPPATPRAVRNDADGEAAFVVCSVRVDDYAGETIRHDGFWPA
jgi:mannose-6-phosphate isomerase-like protein (cupin superfamily)